MTIDTIDAASPERFVRDYYTPRRPVKITGVLDRWPALGKWSFDFLAARGADVRVDVEVGDVLTEATVRQSWDFAAYVRAIAGGRLSDDSRRVPYLSTFPLLEYFPELSADIGSTPWPIRHCFWKAFLGPAGTFSGLHYDRSHGLLSQIRGRKRVVVYPREAWADMYPSRKYDAGSAVSQVDVRQVDEQRWPRFRQTRGAETLLEPGEMLFIPRNCPHHVLSLEPSISLSCFGRTTAETVLLEPHDRVLEMLHRLGLYRRGCCTCHSAASRRSRSVRASSP